MIKTTGPRWNVVLTRGLVLWAAALAAAGWAALRWPREAAEVAGGALLVWALVRCAAAQRAAARFARDLAALQRDIAARVTREAAEQLRDLAVEVRAARGERDAAAEKAAAAEAALADVRGRLDLSGQFLAVVLRWWLAKKSKRAAPTVGQTKLDAAYWWDRVLAVAKARWPGYTWQPDELLAAAEGLAENVDLVRWRMVVNAEFGLTLKV